VTATAAQRLMEGLRAELQASRWTGHLPDPRRSAGVWTIVGHLRQPDGGTLTVRAAGYDVLDVVRSMDRQVREMIGDAGTNNKG